MLGYLSLSRHGLNKSDSFVHRSMSLYTQYVRVCIYTTATIDSSQVQMQASIRDFVGEFGDAPLKDRMTMDANRRGSVIHGN